MLLSNSAKEFTQKMIDSGYSVRCEPLSGVVYAAAEDFGSVLLAAKSSGCWVIVKLDESIQNKGN